MKMKMLWIAVICSLLASACGTSPQSQIKPANGVTLAELEKAKASQEPQPPAMPEVPDVQKQQQQQPVPNPPSTPSPAILKQNAPKPNKPVAAENPVAPPVESAPKAISKPKPVPQSVPVQQSASPDTVAEKRSNQLSWNEFFDNELQNTPSEKFWDLQGQQVVIDGFMGEVLSFDGGWFLLIPRPGAECPFDNGDETYWNKIMIVFVKEKEGLRFTGGPLRITGRLDVGIKVDESNYKTMFRLYEATFEEIK